jgi:alkanesulfonate monooxygenase SsuD/methylene tetrahydromethanopterin reductase-like flavin-dependent oxidoreductase (luciferase family)
MSVRVGISGVPASADLDRIREVVRAADGAGLDVIGIQDHPYPARFLDTWALIPSLLAQTSRVSMFTDVANLPLRPPAMMAKAAATLDVLSGGRFDLGLGAGAFTEIVARLGGPVRTRGESIDALEEAAASWRLQRAAIALICRIGALAPLVRLSAQARERKAPECGDELSGSYQRRGRPLSRNTQTRPRVAWASGPRDRESRCRTAAKSSPPYWPRP